MPSSVLSLVRPGASAWNVLELEYTMFGDYEVPENVEDQEENFHPRREHARKETLEGPDRRRVKNWKAYRRHQYRG